MLSLFSLAAPAPIPVYIVEQRVEAIDVWAAGEAAATRIADLWTTNGTKPSAEFPFTGETDTRKVGANPYPFATRPYVRLSDRRTVGGCWYATTTPPRHDAAFRVPDYAQWKAVTAALPDVAPDPSKHVGTVVDPEVRSVDLDAPDYRPTWNPYRRYIVAESAHVWYYPAATPAAALKAANAQWIAGGVYALGRRLRYAEAADLALPPTPKDSAALAALRKRLPSRPWKALLATHCEPVRLRDRLRGGFETVATALPSQRPPYDDRIVPAGGVPFFTDGL